MARKTVLRMSDYNGRIQAIVEWTVKFQKSHSEMLDRMKAEVWEHADYKKLTRYEVGYLRGVFDVRYRDIYKHLYFAYEIDGAVTTWDEWRKANPDVDGSVIASTFTQEAGNHYWNGTTKQY